MEISVTVYLSTYNQSEYVEQAIDSILMQKTNFPVKVLIADDCSNDGTQDIILGYQNKYPDRIYCYFTSENLGGCKKLTECIDRGFFSGKYLAFLEGDDYWLDESRLQTLVDFLEQNPQYSRVSHKRRVVNEHDEWLGYDIDQSVLDKAFTIDDFLNGKLYSDFGSVFRNYFLEVGSKYHSLFTASRNVCDFQDMFITQDFGPVYVMDKCFGVYRSRSIEGATNYNSVVQPGERCKDHIRIATAVETFYCGKYDLTPYIRAQQKRLLNFALEASSVELLDEYREYIQSEDMREIVPEVLYLLLRGHRRDKATFLLSHLTAEEKMGYLVTLLQYTMYRIGNKLIHKAAKEKKLGYIRECPGGEMS